MKHFLFLICIVSVNASLSSLLDDCDDENCDPLAFFRAERGAKSDDPDIRYKSIIDGYIAIAQVPSIVDIMDDAEQDPLQMFLDNMNSEGAGEYFEEYCNKNTFQAIIPLLRHPNSKIQKGILSVVFHTSKSLEHVNWLLDCKILEDMKFFLKHKIHTFQIFQILQNILKFDHHAIFLESQIIREVLPFLEDAKVSSKAFDVSTTLMHLYSLEERCEMYFKIIPALQNTLAEVTEMPDAKRILLFMTAVASNNITHSSPWECKMIFENKLEEYIIKFFVKWAQMDEDDEEMNFAIGSVLLNLFKLTEKPLPKIDEYMIMKLIFDMLNSNNNDAPIHAALNFLEYLSAREKNVVASTEIIQTFKLLLNKKQSEEVKRHTLQYIMNMGNFTNKHISWIMDQDILADLDKFLETSHKELSKAVEIVVDILEFKEYVPAVMEAGLFPRLVKFLTHENERIRAHSFLSIARIFKHRNEKASISLVEAGAILPFCNQVENEKLKEYVVKGLYNLMYTDKQKRDTQHCEELQKTACLEKLEKLEKDEKEIVRIGSAVIVSTCRGDFDFMNSETTDAKVGEEDGDDATINSKYNDEL